mmetsp:Transcript_79601/g.201157  ORF Transcript_79601/g.201157 Transcript_79601/m.201157 type:complete len:428 (-) Transcript_79601:11-1294(-)
MVGDPHHFTKDYSALGSDNVMSLMNEVFGTSGLFFAATNDPRWSIAHNVLKAPFSIKGMKVLLPMMCEQANKLVARLEKDVGFGGTCHIDRWVTKMAFETIAVCGLGTSFGSFDDDTDHPFITTLKEVIAGIMPFAFCPKILWNIALREKLAKHRAGAIYVRNTCVDVMNQRRQQVTASSSVKRDLMDMMLCDKDPKSGKAMSEDMIVDNVLAFLFAGQDSTAAALATCMCFLNANPRCKEKLVKEIDEVVGSGELEWDHLSKLTYLDWCIKETLRLVSPAAEIVRTATHSQVVGGRWRIDKGENVAITVMALHYDKKIWGEDAEEFKPERWEQGPTHKYAFIPFATGPRACIGREFTMIEQKVTFVKLLQRFDFCRPDNVKAEEGYKTVKKEDIKYPPFINMDVEFKTTSTFVGLFSAFQLLERSQ